MLSFNPAMREIGKCPRERPYWCSHPHCLACNWDDNQRGAASALGAYICVANGYDAAGQRLLLEFFQESRSYVAWLCARCLRDPASVRWFVRTVRKRYPGAVVVRAPRSADERPLGTVRSDARSS